MHNSLGIASPMLRGTNHKTAALSDDREQPFCFSGWRIDYAPQDWLKLSRIRHKRNASDWQGRGLPVRNQRLYRFNGIKRLWLAAC
jgi:hypothetical protein